METKTSNRTQTKTKPYPPSFLDNFMDFVQRLPIPYWLTYLLLFILESLIIHIVAWVEGWQPAFTFTPWALLFPVWLWGPLAIMTYLDTIALDALSSFSPLLDVDEETLKRLKYEFTTMPARGVILSAVIWAIVYVFLTIMSLNDFYVAYGLGPLFTWVTIIAGLVSYSTGSAIYYHSLRLLRLVGRTVKMVRQFNLFHLDPVYAFSRLTSRAGISWMLMLTLTLLLYPLDLARAPVLAILALQVLLALAAFVLPLRFVNLHLAAEKRRLLAELNQRLETTLGRLHLCLDTSELGEVENLNSALTGLNAERDLLTAIPTWPWRTGTLTGFLSAIVLPILLLLAQIIIEKFMGG